jgi:hypothetical protein
VADPFQRSDLLQNQRDFANERSPARPEVRVDSRLQF